MAMRMARRYPANVDVDDLVNVGMLGLIDAVDRFDPSRGVPFKPYADMRIRGAIVDWLRSEDFVPRPTREMQTLLERTRQSLTAHYVREPSQEEMAQALQMDSASYERFRDRATPRKLVSGHQLDPEQQSNPLEQLPSNELLADSLWIEEETREQVMVSVHKLPEREQTVIVRYDIQGRSLREVGDELGITESRVCQIRNQALKRLRIWLRNMAPVH